MSVLRTCGQMSLWLATACLIVGCADETATPDGDATRQTATSVDDHSQWWCVEHAIPEHVCSMCSAVYAKECKEKGDWCVDHNRAKSQCFKCDPSLADQYVRLYKAKYGKQPPAPIE